MKFRFLFILIFLSIGPKAWAVDAAPAFLIQPAEIFVDDEAAILFQVTPKQADQKPESFTLVELDPKTGNPRFSWVLKDEGHQGDFRKEDGLYSRIIQFKEKKPKTIEFWILPQNALPEGPSGKIAGNVQPLVIEKGVLTVKSRPTFIDILREAYYKIRNYFNKNKI